MARRASSRSGGRGEVETYVALLRGINLAGKNRLPMQPLAALFADVGCADVRTYIQSGNVVFSATPKVAKELADTVPRRVAEHFGFRAPLILRTTGELRRTAKANPFLKGGVDAAFLHVAFLDDRPTRPHVAALDAHRSPGDSFQVVGREVYLHLPKGVARTKLTNDYFDSRLATTSTMRNWRTVLKLLEMTQSSP